jgi:uncharacterized protein (DUF488 family)
MLRRQRTILNLLNAADGAVSSTQLQKYIFLLRQETFLGRDGTFYEFLPYKYGAYSFSVQREVEALVQNGYIESVEKSFGVTRLGRQEAKNIDDDTSRAVIKIVTNYGNKPLKSLLKDVYERYPWYASKSDLKEIVPENAVQSKDAPIAVYTMGYEERSVDGFLNILLQKGIRRIVDVRANPVSRKYGFAKSSLSNLAGKLGLLYCHCPDLGITSLKRKDVETPAEFRQLFSYYERKVLPIKADAVAKVVEMVKSMPSVLVCMEKEPVDCHRSRLATLVSSLAGLDIVHL